MPEKCGFPATFTWKTVPFPHRILENYAAEIGCAVSKDIGMLLSNFQRSLAAVVVGNLIYFALLPVLPHALQHGLTKVPIGHWTVAVGKFDFGMLIDFAICAALFVLFGALWSEKKRQDRKTES